MKVDFFTQDGYHPYLELTLSARKKISSVLKHLNNKWGGSRIAIGEPVLFPYAISEDLAGYRWTLNDVGLSAGDVYESIGRPSIFRLRLAITIFSSSVFFFSHFLVVGRLVQLSNNFSIKVWLVLRL